MDDAGRYGEVSRAYVKRYRYVYRQHLFDKLRTLDLSLAEFQQLLGHGEVIAEADAGPDQSKELVLLVEWTRPLHLVVVVDDGCQEERLVTVHEPYPSEWTPDFRRRR